MARSTALMPKAGDRSPKRSRQNFAGAAVARLGETYPSLSRHTPPHGLARRSWRASLAGHGGLGVTGASLTRVRADRYDSLYDRPARAALRR